MKYFLAFGLLISSCGASEPMMQRGGGKASQYVKITMPIRENCAVDYSTLHPDADLSFSINDPGVPEKFKIVHMNELMQLPVSTKLFLKERQAMIYLTSGSITDFAHFDHLKGVVPRGWENTGYTWDDVPGAGDKFGAYLGHPGLPHSANSLALHEIGHTIDFLSGWSKSSSQWLEAYSRWKYRPDPQDRNGYYRMSHVEEFVAAAIDDYFCSPETRSSMEDWYPGLSKLVRESFFADSV